MTATEIIMQIEQAGSWLPLATMRQAFCQQGTLSPLLIEAVRQLASAPVCSDIRLQRLATFGVFFLSQHRNRDVFEPLVRLLENINPAQPNEWLSSERIFFFSHRLMAGVCPLDAERPMKLALNPQAHPNVRAVAVCAVALLAAYGDISRAKVVTCLREVFSSVQRANDAMLDSCWVRTAVKVHSREFERELQWFLASGRIDMHCRELVSQAMQLQPDANFLMITALEPMVDLFSNVFARDLRDGEVGFLPNSQIPGLERFSEPEPPPRTN